MHHREDFEPRQAATMGADEFRVKVLGMSRSAFYAAAKRDALPVPVIRAGRRLLFSRRAVEAMLDRSHNEKSDSERSDRPNAMARANQ